MVQKILKVGDSAAVTIPKKSLESLGLRIGDEVNVAVDILRKRVTIESPLAVDKELVLWTRGFMKKYHAVLEALAHQ